MSITAKEKHLLDLMEDALPLLEHYNRITREGGDVMGKVEFILAMAGRLEEEHSDAGAEPPKSVIGYIP